MACMRYVRFTEILTRIGVNTLGVTSSRSCTTHEPGGKNNNDRAQEDNLDDRDQRLKESILRASLSFVSQHGWTRQALSAGAEKEGLPGVAHGMFTRGGAELVSFLYNDCNSRLTDYMSKEVAKSKEQGLLNPKTRLFIADAIETRLRMIVPYIEQWPQAMAIQTLPQNAPESWTNLSNLMDDVWYHAGDRSTDINWYTKRVSLAAIYKGTEIYMLQDRSDDYASTWSFLDRRLDQLTIFGKTMRNVQQQSTLLGEAMIGISIIGRNILGINNRQR